jgi:metal-dependent HD superfamily phosphatase/phosphodiesterase
MTEMHGLSYPEADPPLPDPKLEAESERENLGEDAAQREARRQAKSSLISKRHYRKSHKEVALDKEIRRRAKGEKFAQLAQAMVDDTLVGSIQNYANVVSIQRLGYNDHGPVHARIVALNCMRIFDLLEKSGVHASIVSEDMGDSEDAQIAIFMAAFLHDLGMSVTRDNHEQHSIYLADPFIHKHLGNVYDDDGKIYMLKCLITECIIGHMGHFKVNSVEAGIVMVGDGADCTRGRALIPSQLAKNPMIGDIHRFSASAIESVSIRKGTRKPVRIDVVMGSSAGLFQVEEVLIGKARISPIMNYLEIAAHLEGKERVYIQ